MSAAGKVAMPTRSIERAMAELAAWRRATSEHVTEFRRWAVVGRSLDEQTAARLAHLERRLLTDRVTIAFVGEYSRGKSELINALFFADLGTRLLPSGPGRTTLCPTEILWDASRPPSLRLLPIETRESPRALREFIAAGDAWEEVALDPSQPRTLAPAIEAIAQARTATGSEAANLGLAAGDEASVEIPRWRYAIVNLPHPALQHGLVILDTPGHNTIGSEPEITVHRLPDAAAIVFMLGADTGVTRSDRELWADHIEAIEGIEHSCYVVLNKIDGLRDGFKTEQQVMADIDKQVRSTSESLRVAAARVFAVSAKQGLTAKIQDDRDALVQSRLFRLEQALARDMVRARRADHATAVRAEARVAFAESQALIESRLAFTRDQLEEITAIRGKNQKLVEALARKAQAERVRVEQARATLMGLRSACNRQADKLARLLDPNRVREEGVQARSRVLQSAFSSQIGEALDQFFRGCRGRMREAMQAIADAGGLMNAASRKFAEEYKVASMEAPDFGTGRFIAEIDRLELVCARDFKGTGSLLTRRRSTLATLFFDTVALKVAEVFEIAHREGHAWIAGFLRPLEAQLNGYAEQAEARTSGMGRMRAAETDLVAHQQELGKLAENVRDQLEDGEDRRRRLMALLEVDDSPG